MDEFTWQASSDLLTMLSFIQCRTTKRKLRLFACACCRRLASFLTEPCSWVAVLSAEAAAEGSAPPQQLALVRKHLRADFRRRKQQQIWQEAFAQTQDREQASRVSSAWGGAWDAAFAVLRSIARDAAYHAADAAARALGVLHPPTFAEARAAERAWQIQLLHDVVGPWPFQSWVVPSAWLDWQDGTIPALARSAYQHRQLPSGFLEPDRLLVLADALEDVLRRVTV